MKIVHLGSVVYSHITSVRAHLLKRSYNVLASFLRVKYSVPTTTSCLYWKIFNILLCIFTSSQCTPHMFMVNCILCERTSTATKYSQLESMSYTQSLGLSWPSLANTWPYTVGRQHLVTVILQRATVVKFWSACWPIL